MIIAPDSLLDAIVKKFSPDQLIFSLILALVILGIVLYRTAGIP